MDNSKRLKLAVQKDGRLTEKTLAFLEDAGLEFDAFARRLYAACRNFPLDIVFVRDDDIPRYVAQGTADLGFVGRDVLYETAPAVDTVMPLPFGFCSLKLAVPRESAITDIGSLRGRVIATSFPRSVKRFFADNSIPVETLEIGGAVEIAPALGLSAAVADLVSTGSTMALNDLRPIATIFESTAVLISRPGLTGLKKTISDRLELRFRGVVAASSWKYVILNAPCTSLPALTASVPSLKSPTITPLADPGWVSVATAVREESFWETMEKLKRVGATDIIVLPIEKMVP